MDECLKLNRMDDDQQSMKLLFPWMTEDDAELQIPAFLRKYNECYPSCWRAYIETGVQVDAW